MTTNRLKVIRDRAADQLWTNARLKVDYSKGHAIQDVHYRHTISRLNKIKECYAQHERRNEMLKLLANLIESGNLVLNSRHVYLKLKSNLDKLNTIDCIIFAKDGSKIRVKV